MATATSKIGLLGKIDWRHPSESLNPVFVKEIRQGLRAKGFVGPFTLIHACLMIGLGLELLEVNTIGSSNTFGPVFFWSVVVVFLLVAIPFVGINAITKEVKGHHVELFRLAGISRWRIVLGKWLSLFLQSLLITVSIIPYVLLRFLIGGIELFEALGWLLLVLSQSGNAIALGLALSSFRSTMGRVFGMMYLPFTLAQNVGASCIALWIQKFVPDWTLPGFYVTYAAAASLGSIVILLSIASGKIQLFERTYGGDKGNSLVLLYAATPYIVAFVSLMTVGFGMPIAWIFLAWVAGKHQATRDGDSDLLYTSRRLQTAPLQWSSLPPEGPERLAYLRERRAQMIAQADGAETGGQVGSPASVQPGAPQATRPPEAS